MLRMIIIIFVITSVSIFSQEKYDSCNCEAKRIISTYERLEKNYIQIAKEKLLYYLNTDTVMKNMFLTGDSSIYNDLKIRIYPLLVLDYEARNYNFGENICKHFVFDTINLFFSAADFFYEGKIMFNLSAAYYDCYIAPLCPGSEFKYSDEEERIGYAINQFFYDNKNKPKKSKFYYIEPSLYHIEPSILIYDSISSDRLNFAVKGLDSYTLYISKSYISVHDEFRINTSNPNDYIKKLYNIEWIRYCARSCSIGGVPWWRFWDWEIFSSKPSPFRR